MEERIEESQNMWRLKKELYNVDISLYIAYKSWVNIKEGYVVEKKKNKITRKEGKMTRAI